MSLGAPSSLQSFSQRLEVVVALSAYRATDESVFLADHCPAVVTTHPAAFNLEP